MNGRLFIWLAVGCWVSGIPVHLGFTYQIFFLPFCSSKQLRVCVCVCNIPPVLKIAYVDTFMIKMLIYVVVAVIVVTIPFMLILWSYLKIIGTILKLLSAMGRVKAFPTCSSHFMVVALLFGLGIMTYLRPNSSHSVGWTNFFLFFTQLSHQHLALWYIVWEINTLWWSWENLYWNGLCFDQKHNFKNFFSSFYIILSNLMFYGHFTGEEVETCLRSHSYQEQNWVSKTAFFLIFFKLKNSCHISYL